MTKTEEIKAVIANRYYCGEYPTGALSDLAIEFGVSRQLVWQIAKSMGLKGPSTNVRRFLPIVLCAVCGKQIKYQNKTGICQSCRWIELPCVNCGELLKRSANNLAKRNGKSTNRGTYTGRVFCNQKCFYQWVGKTYGFKAKNH